MNSWKVYRVGGAVRDRLLGLPVHDQDWVVVGASAPDLLAQGFLPVGRDFPVFLHPQTRDEYALARTERKHGVGYRGFTVWADPTVTLEQDLARRDLTINAMAEDETGHLIDPFNGQRDLEQRWLRHVSPAFRDDPVRLLRVARFAARFHHPLGFRVAAETMDLMQEMVRCGEADALVPERIWQELARGLWERNPGTMFLVLDQCGALERLLPEIAPWWQLNSPTALASLATAARLHLPINLRWATWLYALLQDAPHQGRFLVKQLSTRLRLSQELTDLTTQSCIHGARITHSLQEPAPALLELLESLDALRRPARFENLLAIHGCCLSQDVHSPFIDNEQSIHRHLRHALAAALEVPAGTIARHCVDPAEIPERIRSARIEAIHAALN